MSIPWLQFNLSGKDEVTFSVIEIPKPRDQSTTPEENNDQIEAKEIICTATPEYR